MQTERSAVQKDVDDQVCDNYHLEAKRSHCLRYTIAHHY